MRETAQKDVTNVRQNNKKRLHQTIRNKYYELTNTQDHGVTMYRQAYIFQLLAKKFFRSPRTIENIIFGKV